MGLREVFQSAAQTVIQAFGNVAVSANYESFASATYNASAGTNVATFSTTVGVSIIFEVFRLTEVDGQRIQPQDKKALIAGLDIPGVTPGPQDRITLDASSVVWEVKDVMTDPADALWTLQVRRP